MTRVYALLTAALTASVFGQWAGAATGDYRLNIVYAALAVLALVATTAVINARAWRARAAATPLRHALAATNARLIGAAWGWGGASMLAVYLFSGLKWQHGWQYGAGMALIAAGIFLYSRQLTVEGMSADAPPAHAWSIRITALQSAAATVALFWLLFSGKLAAGKTDWAANVVFVAGGVALVVLSDLAVATNARLARIARARIPVTIR